MIRLKINEDKVTTCFFTIVFAFVADVIGELKAILDVLLQHLHMPASKKKLHMPASKKNFTCLRAKKTSHACKQKKLHMPASKIFVKSNSRLPCITKSLTGIPVSDVESGEDLSDITNYNYKIPTHFWVR